MEENSVNSLCVSDFCFFNTGAKPDPKQTGEGWRGHWEWKTLVEGFSRQEEHNNKGTEEGEKTV